MGSSVLSHGEHVGRGPHSTTHVSVPSLLSSSEPPSMWQECTSSIREAVLRRRGKLPPPQKRLVSVLQGLFPVLRWGRSYDVKSFRSDLMAGLTVACLGVPQVQTQETVYVGGTDIFLALLERYRWVLKLTLNCLQSIGYANLAKLDPQYGLYTSVVPPLIYAVMGSSREIAIGPVAVISLLLSTMIQRAVDLADPVAYKKLVFTVTFFAGLFQAAFGLFRLGFLVDFLSHAALVGFTGGAAIVIGLQQLKGLLGIPHFTNNTDVISVIKAVWNGIHEPWRPGNFLLGCSFLIFILITRFIGRRRRKLFWLPAISPLISVFLSTLLVFMTKADNHGVKTIKHIEGGLNPSSANQLEFSGPFVAEAAKIGLICAIIALTEAIAVGRSFASVKGYHLDGNKEMLAMGCMNLAGSLSSCYVATGSFSRTAVNFSAGCKTTVSNVVMAITVIISLELLTKLLYYTPTAILGSIILSSLPGLIDVREAYKIWNVDKLDFLACLGAFFGVLFGSVEIGLLAAVTISFAKIILNSLRPRIEVLGRLDGTEIFCSIRQFPTAIKTSKILIIRIDSSFLCFINANFVRERILGWVNEDRKMAEENPQNRVQAIVLDMSNVMNIDTSGIIALEEVHKKLHAHGLQIAVANPGWQVIHKMRLAKFSDRIRDWLFLTVGEAVEACLGLNKSTTTAC